MPRLNIHFARVGVECERESERDKAREPFGVLIILFHAEFESGSRVQGGFNVTFGALIAGFLGLFFFFLSLSLVASSSLREQSNGTLRFSPPLRSIYFLDSSVLPLPLCRLSFRRRGNANKRRRLVASLMMAQLSSLSRAHSAHFPTFRCPPRLRVILLLVISIARPR